MAKRKHSADWMLARVREYLSGKGSYQQIARANGFPVFHEIYIKNFVALLLFFAAPSFLIPYAGEDFKHNPRAARLPPNLLNFFMDKRG